MKRLILSICLLFVAFLASVQGQVWSEQKANDWYRQQPWYCGVNYIPANAINYTAMWDKTSFSPLVIDKEIRLAGSIGINCVRVVLQYAVYADDPGYFIRTLDKFLKICDKYKVKVMPCFFDDCVFGMNADPVIGKQPEPLEGWYAWAWSPSPGHTMVVDRREHAKLEKYVRDIMGHFRNDPRIFVWDLYNEPTNGGLGDRSLPLVKEVFQWARTVQPSQPVSIGIWNDYKPLNDLILANSDIITFHCYSNREYTEKRIRELLVYHRPVICTEWMNRVVQSKIESILPVFKEHNVGNLLWGLVNGKTQTHLPWGFRPEKLPYQGEWQHDLFRGDFTPYDPKEIDLIKKLTQTK